MENPHARTVDDVIKYFNTDVNFGLTDKQIEENQEKYGPNGKIISDVYDVILSRAVDGFAALTDSAANRFITVGLKTAGDRRRPQERPQESRADRRRRKWTQGGRRPKGLQEN